MNNRIASGARLFLLLAACCALNACVAPVPPGATGKLPPAQAARRHAERGDYARAAELYAYAARRHDRPGQRNRLRLEAAIAALRAGRTGMSKRLLAAVQPAHLNQADYQRYELARRLLRIAAMPPERALAQLPPPGNVPPGLAAYIWKTRAELLFEQYQYIAGIHSLIQRSVWLLGEQAIRQNNRLIFQRALQAVELGRGADSPAARRADATTLGWLRLAEIKKQGLRGPALKKALKRWENRFTGHPATRGLVSSVFNYKPYSSPLPPPRVGDGVSQGPIALVLPLSGNIARRARAVRAGFRMARANSNTMRPLVIIDSTGLSAHEIVQRARAKDAALIVGPLKKSKVRALARLAPRIPVLALNQAQTINAPAWFFRYALAPEDDARTAAAHAAARGWNLALALVPKGRWGERVLNAFRNAFAKRGGTLVDAARFATSRYDHQYAVQSVLRSYHNGVPIDFVFIAARPAHARLLRSQLRFFYAARLPVIATSDVYSGVPAPRKDTDLNGVAFAAVPWVIGADPALEAMHRRARARASYAGQRFPRLFAMGIDAWRLARELTRNGLEPGMIMQGVTGVLEVEPNGRIRRHLAWAKFVNGRARLVAPASASGPDTFRVDNPGTRPRAHPVANTPPAQPARQPPRQTPAYGPVYSTEAAAGD